MTPDGKKILDAASVLDNEPRHPANPAVARFTPGPWRKERDGSHCFFIYATAPHSTFEVSPARAHSEADACLIVVAPDLYAQLEDAKATLEEAAKLLVSHYPSVANNIVNQCAIRCGDILTKARGEPT